MRCCWGAKRRSPSWGALVLQLASLRRAAQTAQPCCLHVPRQQLTSLRADCFQLLRGLGCCCLRFKSCLPAVGS